MVFVVQMVEKKIKRMIHCLRMTIAVSTEPRWDMVLSVFISVTSEWHTEWGGVGKLSAQGPGYLKTDPCCIPLSALRSGPRV